MATVLGACGCCGGGCGPVKENCNVALRQYMNVGLDDSQVTVTTTDQYVKECWENRNSQPCYGIIFSAISFSPCTGAGVIGYSYFNPMDPGNSGYSGELGTVTASYQDESIDWDKIEELDLTELEQQQKLCKFSYKFNFNPTEDATYYVVSIPCSDQIGYAGVSLNSEGKATFYGRYNGSCLITPR